jgi:hypothetical protein
MSGKDMVVVTHGNNFIAVSIYLDIGKDITGFQQNKDHTAVRQGGLLMAVDSKARSKTLHDVITKGDYCKSAS